MQSLDEFIELIVHLWRATARGFHKLEQKSGRLWKFTRRIIRIALIIILTWPLVFIVSSFFIPAFSPWRLVLAVAPIFAFLVFFVWKVDVLLLSILTIPEHLPRIPLVSRVAPIENLPEQIRRFVRFFNTLVGLEMAGGIFLWLMPPYADPVLAVGFFITAIAIFFLSFGTKTKVDLPKIVLRLMFCLAPILLLVTLLGGRAAVEKRWGGISDWFNSLSSSGLNLPPNFTSYLPFIALIALVVAFFMGGKRLGFAKKLLVGILIILAASYVCGNIDQKLGSHKSSISRAAEPVETYQSRSQRHQGGRNVELPPGIEVIIEVKSRCYELWWPNDDFVSLYYNGVDRHKFENIPGSADPLVPQHKTFRAMSPKGTMLTIIEK